MRYNRFILQHIMENKFINTIRIKVANDLRKLDEYDLNDIFEGRVDIIALASIAGIGIDGFDIEKNSVGTAISGEMLVRAEINGFIKQNKEWVIVGGGMLNLGYSFWFMEQNGKFSDLELEYSY